MLCATMMLSMEAVFLIICSLRLVLAGISEKGKFIKKYRELIPFKNFGNLIIYDFTESSLLEAKGPLYPIY